MTSNDAFDNFLLFGSGTPTYGVDQHFSGGNLNSWELFDGEAASFGRGVQEPLRGMFGENDGLHESEFDDGEVLRNRGDASYRTAVTDAVYPTAFLRNSSSAQRRTYVPFYVPIGSLQNSTPTCYGVDSWSDSSDIDFINFDPPALTSSFTSSTTTDTKFSNLGSSTSTASNPLSPFTNALSPACNTMFYNSANVEEYADGEGSFQRALPHAALSLTPFSERRLDVAFPLSKGSKTESFASQPSLRSNEKKSILHSLYIQCLQCPKTFGRRSDLERHLKSVHLSHTSYACVVTGCDNNKGRGYSRIDKLREHQWRKHWELGYRKGGKGRKDPC